MQLSLPIYRSEEDTFANFYPSKNGQLLAAIHNCLNNAGSYLYFWSSQGAGRSHLLHAACNFISNLGKQVFYLPLEKKTTFTSDILDGMEQISLICLDNIEAIVGDTVWEEALFDLYNRIHESKVARLLVTGNCAVRQLNLHLPDLSSRLNWGPIYKLHPLLTDRDKLCALQMRACLRGFDLPADIGYFLLKRLSRDMRTLFNTLDQLDQASLTAHRKLTIPFVKATLNL